jgi:predicted RecA/RadA family phage recombinase
MKNFVQEGNTLDYVAGATHAGGAVVRVGNVLGVNAYDVTSGQEGVLHFGVFVVPKVSGAVIARGETLLWDASAGAFDDNLATPATGDVGGATAFAYEAAGNGVTTIAVKFTGVPGTLT